MSKRSKKIISAVLILILILILVFSRSIFRAYPRIQHYLKTKELERENKETMEEVKKAATQEPVVPEVLPETKFLEVPFICQAPLQTVENWKLHETSCEEAALLQAYLYETKSNITKEEANQEIFKMTDWQNQNMGGEHDLYADEMKQFIMGYYGLTDDQVEIIYDASIEDLKTEINADHPVIVPVTAKLIGNPYYPYPGYHMLTVIGWHC